MRSTDQQLAVGCDHVDLTACQNFGDGDLELRTDRMNAVAVLPDGRTVVAQDAEGIMFSNWATNSHVRITQQGNQGFVSNDIVDVVVDPVTGDVWLASQQDGASRMTPVTAPAVAPANASTFTTFDQNDGLPSDEVRSIEVAPSGVVYFGTTQGVAVLGAAVDVLVFDDNDGLPANNVRDIAIDVVTVNGSAREIAWVATGGGLGRIDAARVTAIGITAADGLPNKDCRSVVVHPDHRKVVGTPAGVFSYSGL